MYTAVGFLIPYTAVVCAIGILYGVPVYLLLRTRSCDNYAYYISAGAIPGLTLVFYWLEMALFLAAYGALAAVVFRFTIVRVDSNPSPQARRP